MLNQRNVIPVKVRKAAIDDIERGMPQEQVADALGVSLETVNLWVARARAGALKQRNVVPTDVREEAIHQIECGRRRDEVADELNVSLSTVNLWMAKVRAAGRIMQQDHMETTEAVFTPINPQPQEHTYDYLQMRIRQLEIDIEHLKEAWAVDVKNLKKKLAVYEGNDPKFEGTEE